MNRTPEFEALTVNRGPPRPRIYSPLDDATSLITKINKMKTHLSKYGHDYLNTYGCLPGASMMNDEWRKKLDRDVEDFINVCNDKVNLLNQEIMLGADSDQVIEYRKAVIQIVMRFLNGFVSYSTQLRNNRMKRNFIKERYDRVQCKIKQVSAIEEYESMSSLTKDSITDSRDKLTSLLEDDDDKTPNRSIRLDDYEQHSQIAAENDIEITPSDVQVLLVENSRIHDELVTLNDEVKTIGKKVVQISRLQELFTEKVMEQEMELNNLHEVAIASSENVREGNEMIREAMMKNASTRVFILFYIITLGFTILFLDWYNP